MSTGTDNDDATGHRSSHPREDCPEESEDTPPEGSGRTGFMSWARRAILMLLSATLLSIVVVIAALGPLLYVGPLHVDPPFPAATAHLPCPPAWGTDPITDAELESLAQRRWREFQWRLRREPLPRTEQALRDHVDAAFDPVYARIPGFLDWHYSAAGQYTQLAQAISNQLLESQLAQAALDRLRNSQLARAALARLHESQLAQAALDRLQGSERIRSALDQLQQGVDSRLFADLPDRIRDASVSVERVMQKEMRTLVEQRIRNEAQTLPAAPYAGPGTPCPDVGTAGLRVAYERMLRTAMPHTMRRFTATAAPTGILAAGAGFRGAAAAGALIRGLSRRLLPGSLLSRTASGTARAVGTAVAGLATGAAAWLLVDAAVLFVDEHFNRDDLERELTALVDQQKAEIEAAMSRAVADARSEALGASTPSEL